MIDPSRRNPPAVKQRISFPVVYHQIPAASSIIPSDFQCVVVECPDELKARTLDGGQVARSNRRSGRGCLASSSFGFILIYKPRSKKRLDDRRVQFRAAVRAYPPSIVRCPNIVASVDIPGIARAVPLDMQRVIFVISNVEPSSAHHGS